MKDLVAWGAMLVTFFLLVFSLFIHPVIADSSESERGGRRPPGPPKEAIEACEGKSSGDAVSFSGRRGETVEATCRTMRGQLVAVPLNAPEGRRPERKEG